MDEDNEPVINLPFDSVRYVPIDLFSLFFTDEILGTIVDSTNENFANRKELTGKDQHWNPMNVYTLKKYIGILVMMGIDRKSAFDMHTEFGTAI